MSKYQIITPPPARHNAGAEIKQYGYKNTDCN